MEEFFGMCDYVNDFMDGLRIYSNVDNWNIWRKSGKRRRKFNLKSLSSVKWQKDRKRMKILEV